MSKTELYDQKRQKILRHYLFGFIVWGTVLAITMLRLEQLNRTVAIILVGIGILGWLYWCFYLVRLMQFMRALRANPKTAAALNDEYSVQIRLQSSTKGFWAMLICQGFIVLLAVFNVSMPALFSPILTIVVGVVTAIGYSIYREQA